MITLTLTNEIKKVEMVWPNTTIYCCEVTNTKASFGNNDIWPQKIDWSCAWLTPNIIVYVQW